MFGVSVGVNVTIFFYGLIAIRHKDLFAGGWRLLCRGQPQVLPFPLVSCLFFHLSVALSIIWCFLSCAITQAQPPPVSQGAAGVGPTNVIASRWVMPLISDGRVLPAS